MGTHPSAGNRIRQPGISDAEVGTATAPEQHGPPEGSDRGSLARQSKGEEGRRGANQSSGGATGSPGLTRGWPLGLKLVAAIGVSAVTIATACVLLLQWQFSATYQAYIERQVVEQAEALRRDRLARQEVVRRAVAVITRDVRLTVALEEGDAKRAALDLSFILPRLLAAYWPVDEQRGFFMIAQPDGASPIVPEGTPAEDPLVSRLVALVGDPERWLDLEKPASAYLLNEGRLMEFYLAPLTNRFEGTLYGTLVIGFPMAVDSKEAEDGDGREVGTIWEETEDDPGLSVTKIESRLVDASARGLAGPLEASRVQAAILADGGADGATVAILAGQQVSAELGTTEAASLPSRKLKAMTVNGTPILMREGVLEAPAGFPSARELIVYDLSELIAARRQLWWYLAGMVTVAILASGLVGTLLSGRFTRPVLELVQAAEAIGAGQLTYRVAERGSDEIATLKRAFNRMGEGLLEKEKVRHVLDRVTDSRVADLLLAGQLVLGGESRVVTMLFCDIRGFTALSDGLDPQQVVAMINAHMTAMTEVAHQFGGVVDKFVGDEIIVLFGAPHAFGDDAARAIACSLAMLQERDRLNLGPLEAMRGPPIQIGIGLATGSVVAGCMGSTDRLNYTVLGDRVNLAARLCGQARAGEVVLDEPTAGSLHDLEKHPRESLSLKGLTAAVPVVRLMAHSLPSISTLAPFRV